MDDLKSTDEFIVSARFQELLESKIPDIELFYSVLLKFSTRLPVSTTLLKSDREKVTNNTHISIKVRGPFKSIYKVRNYVEALCGAGPHEVGLLYEANLIPVWNGLQGFWLKYMEFESCAPIISINRCSLIVKPVSEFILNRFMQRIEELGQIVTPNFRERELPDAEMIEQNFEEVLDRCAESDESREALKDLPARAKDRLLWMVREAGQAFQPTKIRRQSWKEIDEKREEEMQKIFPDKARKLQKDGLKRRFSLLEPKTDEPKIETTRNSSISGIPQSSRIVQKETEQMMTDSDEGSAFKFSPVKREGKNFDFSPPTPEAQDAAFSFRTINTSVFEKYKQKTEESHTPDVIVISDDDEGKRENRSQNINLPDPDTIASWFRDNYQPWPSEDASVYKQDVWNLFSNDFGFSTDSDGILTLFFQCLNEYMSFDSDYKLVVQKGNTGVKSRKRFVNLVRRNCFSKMNSGSNGSLNVPGTPNARPKSPKFQKSRSNSLMELNERPNTPMRPGTPNQNKNYQVNLVPEKPPTANLKPIIIDGSNVAMEHNGRGRWSSRGLAIVVEYFYKRGHREITAFVPGSRKSHRQETLKPPTHERYILDQLEHLGYLAWTPSRWIQGKGRVNAYDDRFVVKCAAEKQGIIVSNDNYRDLTKEAERDGNVLVKNCIENSVLQFTFVGDMFMCPDDPMGRFGPKLDDFLMA